MNGLTGPDQNELLGFLVMPQNLLNQFLGVKFDEFSYCFVTFISFI